MKIYSFGEIIWDVFPDGRRLGGAPLNFAAHVAMQGAQVELISRLGGGEWDGEARRLIESFGVGTSLIGTDPELPCGRCTVSLNDEGVPTYSLDALSAYDRIEAPQILGDGADAICFGSLALRYESNRAVLDRMLRSNSFREVFVDINVRPPFYSRESIEFCLSRATMLKISDEDMHFVLSELFGDASMSARAAVLALSELYPDIHTFIVTLGEQGSLCYLTSSSAFYSCEAVRAEVVSTVGAGDSFGATMLLSLLSGMEVQSAMRRASLVSSFVVSHIGAVPEDMPVFLRSL